jgi:cation:H+ antiporter
MSLYFDIFTILLSLILLIQGSEWLVQGAVTIAKYKKISDLIIASTIIAFGIGLPTIAVNVAFVLLNSNSNDIVVGNGLGTNLVNIGLGLGIPALLVSLYTKYQVFEKEIPIFLVISGLLTSFVLDGFLSRVEGFVILALYLLTLIIIYQYSLRERVQSKDYLQIDLNTSTISETSTKEVFLSKGILLIVIGMIILASSSLLLTLMIPRFSQDFGISEYLIGLTIVGIGTSLPMVITSIKSSLKGFSDIVLGNVFGSTIANIGLGLGLPAIISPLYFNAESLKDIQFFNILIVIVIFTILIKIKLFGDNKILSKVSGGIIVIFYLSYLVLKIFP